MILRDKAFIVKAGDGQRYIAQYFSLGFSFHSGFQSLV